MTATGDTAVAPRGDSPGRRSAPRVLQPFVTWVTGVPLAGSRARMRWRPALAAAPHVFGLGFLVVGAANRPLLALALRSPGRTAKVIS